jgi:DHA1 family bicyclomycin/chloramphenicol resistance-like MFS transporter
MAVAALTNARLVERLGMRKLSHAAMCGFILVALGQAAMAMSGHDTLLSFALLQAAMMFCFGLLAGNIEAIAMEPLGHVAGTAAAVQGCLSMLGAALIGSGIGQSFNDTLTPVALGFCICGVLALAMMAIAEQGQLFRAHGSGG